MGTFVDELPPGPNRGQSEDDYVPTAQRWAAALPNFGRQLDYLGVQFNLAAGVLQFGYLKPVAYEAGLKMTIVSQTVEHNGFAYSPILLALPFTTSGVFEEDKFRLQQSVTFFDLASSGGAGRLGVLQVGIGAILRTQANKNADLISAKDFGAVGDGVTNDTVAVTKAVSAGVLAKSPVLIPKCTSHAVALAGYERFKTVYSEPWETDYIARYMNDAYAGVAVIFAFFGDSTFFGSNPANLAAQVDEPAPARLQILLRRFFANNNITVQNNAIPGTTVRQMLTGADGSGQTFEDRIAATAALIIYVNHCINSCQLGDSADSYKRDMHMVAEICRKYGKTVVFVTPNPMAPTIIGDRRKTMQLGAYAEAMRQVCREAGIPLVDNWTWVTKMLATGRYSVLDIIPDGCHPSSFFYTVLGQNCAIPLICPDARFTGPDQYLAAMSAQVLGSAAGPSVSANSRLGGGIISGIGGAQSVRMVFVVEEGGLDIYVAIPIWPSGAAHATITVDRVVFAADFSFNDPAGRAGGRFIQDHEVRVIENARPGLHIVELECSTGGSVGAYYVRTRKTRQETALSFGINANYRQPVMANFEFYSNVANSILLLDSIATPRWDRPFRIEVTAVWQPGVGIVLAGSRIGDNGITPAQIEAGFIVGLDTNGFASVWECVGGAYSKLVTGATNFSGQRQAFYIRAVGGRFGSIELYVNSALVGTAVITRPYWGGLMGVWKEAAAGSWMIERVDYLNDATV